MPPQGAEGRADQRATLARLSHELLVSDELGRLLDELRPREEELAYDSDDASLLRVARRDHEKARRVPPELRAELSRAGSLGVGAGFGCALMGVLRLAPSRLARTQAA